MSNIKVVKTHEPKNLTSKIRFFFAIGDVNGAKVQKFYNDQIRSRLARKNAPFSTSYPFHLVFPIHSFLRTTSESRITANSILATAYVKGKE